MFCCAHVSPVAGGNVIAVADGFVTGSAFAFVELAFVLHSLVRSEIAAVVAVAFVEILVVACFVVRAIVGQYRICPCSSHPAALSVASRSCQ